MLRFSVYVLILTWTVRAQDLFDFSCYDNQTQCIVYMGDVLVNEDKFWFGSRYRTDCPDGAPSSAACNNPDTVHASILSRLLNSTNNTDLNQARQAISLVHVNFTSPQGTIYACEHTFQIPALTNQQIDPLHITRFSSWSLTRVPSLTWTPKNGTAAYTVIIWDVGHFILHTLHINCRNGSMASGQAVKEYGGPRNPFLRENVYLFLVYEQNATLDFDVVRQITNSSVGGFHPQSLFSSLGGSINNRPSFANLMTVVGDAYSIQLQKDAFRVNNCPYLISQLPPFRSVVEATNISVSWGGQAANRSVDAIIPYLTTLRVSIQVEYSTDDFSLESCCTNYSLTRGMFKADPFSMKTERPGMVRLTPRVQFSPMDIVSRNGISGETYTLFTLDVAPAMASGAQNPSFVTHWLVTNIRNADISTGDELAPYFGPNPFTPNEARPYMSFLVRQPVSKLNNSVLAEFCPSGAQRCSLKLKPLMDAWNLRDIVGLTWFMAEQDAFARYRLYDVIKAKTKDVVCTGLPGYGEPCPKPCSNIGLQQRQQSLTFFTVLFMFILCTSA